jgi:hypothetical protein
MMKIMNINQSFFCHLLNGATSLPPPEANIDALAIIGEYTVNGTPVAGHEDYFGNTSDGALKI